MVTVRRWSGALVRSAAYCALLLPVALAAFPAIALGRRASVVGRWQALRVRLLGEPAPASVRTPRTTMIAAHAVASLLLGLVALVPLGMQVLWLFRAVLYGFVDRGPYDHSWGGPTRAGAWLVHFLVGTGQAFVGLVALAGIAALHQRLTAGLDGARSPRWLVPTVAVTGVATGLFVVAWTRQL
jgi:hypothetical protein